ncbi:HOTHEAD-like isoform X1 [Olea europaea subsp. europaea]|uniref:HOTHEAD-like isoform X1 n=1 Tax=Olea europaea subsp. europaea TaxID=158383 RepID=A0A8S0UX68_OLEEU|nr:HOTHEAD-like isoform X1 [Olea europaea subsp. europaea]
MAYLSNGAMNEIILPSGALRCRQLLIQSGIGPAQQLSTQGIKVILDQPNVGQGMSDNPMNSGFIPSPQPVEISLIQVTDYPFIIPFNVSMQEAKLGPEPYRYANLQAGVILEKIVRPFSTGHLELQSRDPNDNPRITFNYLNDPRDVQRCV